MIEWTHIGGNFSLCFERPGKIGVRKTNENIPPACAEKENHLPKKLYKLRSCRVQGVAGSNRGKSLGIRLGWT